MINDSPEQIPSFNAELKSSTWCHAPELFALFILGFALMSFIQSGRGGVNGDYVAVAGHDSFYHIKMAMLLPEIGLIDEFPWLTTTIFADKFVSHHYGFHLLLTPFIQASAWFGSGDPLEGGRWGIAFFFGVVTLLFDWLLIVGGVRYRPLWWLMFLVMPHQFFSRHVFIRAICPSLVFMLMILWSMFHRRWLLTAGLIFIYIQVYLGAVMFVPLLVISYYVAGAVGPAHDRVSWKLPTFALVGWFAGIMLHPYGGWDVIDFLRVQVWGTGLNPDIPAGREWRSYASAWFFTKMSAATLLLLASAICFRLRCSLRCDARALCLLIVSFAFLALTLKARRFIEYWPIFSLLSSAYLFAPPYERHTNIAENDVVNATGHRNSGLSLLLACSLFTATSMICILYLNKLHTSAFLAAWPKWLIVLAILCIPSAIKASGDRSQLASRSVLLRTLLIVLSTVALVTGVVALGSYDRNMLLGITNWRWLCAGAIGISGFVLWLVTRKGLEGASTATHSNLAEYVKVTVTGVGLALAAMLLAGPSLDSVQRGARCKFDLAAVSGTMEYLVDHSQPGEIVFTDDWDVFGLYFFYNHHNRYVVGLDPKFTHERDPILWERYVAITQAKTPTTVDVELSTHDGKKEVKQAEVTLSDIRTFFQASWVVVDDDHLGFANKLDNAPDLATRVYTSPQLTSQGRSRYTVYRIKSAVDQPRRNSAMKPNSLMMKRGELSRNHVD